MDLKRVGTKFDRVRVDINENFDKIEGKYKGLQKRFDNAVEEVSEKAFDKVVDRAKIDWLPPVDTFDDLATTYPDATEGQTSMTRDTGKIYRMTNGVWMEIQDFDATAINEVDARLSAELEGARQDLESRGYDIRWNALDAIDDDWGLAINKINDYLVSKGGGVILLPKIGVFTYKTNINISKGISLSGLGASLKADARNVTINFAGSNLVDGVIFDGNDKTGRAVVLQGDKSYVHRCTVKNVYGDESTTNTVGIHITKQANYCVIKDCAFDKLSAFENGIEGDLIGAVRAIWLQGQFAVIDNNNFLGMEGYEDADYIYVSADLKETNEYPANKSPLVNGFFAETFAVITNNTFYNATKSAIKLQSSGNLIANNTLINVGVDLRYAWRGYSTTGNVVKNNSIYLYGCVVTSSVYQFQYNLNTVIKDNTLHTDATARSEIVNAVDLIYNAEMIFDGNELNFSRYNVDNIFYLSGARRMTLSNNKFSGTDVRQTYTFNQDLVSDFRTNNNEISYERTNFPVVMSTNGSAKNVNFEGNKFMIGELLPSASHFFAFRNVDNLNIIDNHIVLYKKDQSIQVRIEGCTDVEVQRNAFDARVTVSDGSKNVDIIDNVFNKDVLSAVFVNNEAGEAPENVRVIKNVAHKCTYFVSLNGNKSKKNIEVIDNTVGGWTTDQHNIIFIDAAGRPVQRMEEIYVKGNTPARRFDYGFTSERPAYKKDVGYSYFDWSLGYVITWNDTNWVNGNGDTV
ncbi:hypothetical protein [Shouchella clausii]|uniref:hypothetical protein n=1 Tax=Shouchella clausii TaxID=79880 RepID=UPI001652B9F7|nr:hypothetical protein [Shouchella clausii]QNM43757.1 hypothetical protein DUT88_13005 [Shouchella clausii]